MYDADKNSKTFGVILMYSPSLLGIQPQVIYDNVDSFSQQLLYNSVHSIGENDGERLMFYSGKIGPILSLLYFLLWRY
jgi:hypothetical protein